MEEKNLSFEEALKELETMVEKLEKGEVKLEEAFKTFEDGLKYAKLCEEKLTNIENKVAKILDKNNEEKDLEIEEN